MADDRFRALVERSQDIALLVDADGVVAYVNPAVRHVLGYEPEMLIGSTGLELVHPDDVPLLRQAIAAQKANPDGVLRLELRVLHADRAWRVLESVSTSLLHVPSVEGLIVTCRDITERKRAERRIVALNRVYAVMSDIDQAIVRLRDEQDLLDEACRIAVETGGFRMAWIGCVTPEGHVVPVAHAGEEQGYLEGLPLERGSEPFGSGPTAPAMRRGEPSVCQDIESDPRMAPWREAALRRGYRSSASFPLRVFGRLWGTLSLHASEPGSFPDDEVQLLAELAHDLSFAVEFLRSRAQRREAEVALGASEERYRTLFESHPHPMWVYDTDTLAFLAVNNAAVETYGYSRDEFLAMTIADIRPSEDVPALMRNVANLRGGLEHAGLWRHRLKDGRIIDVEITSHTMTFGSRPAEVVLAIDVTARRRMEHALQDSEARFRAFFEQAAVGVAQVQTVAGQFVHVNQKFCQIVGYTRDELLGLPVASILHPEDRAAARRQYDQLMAGEVREFTIEKRYVRKDGRPVWVSLTASPMWQPGEPPGFHVAVVQEIEARKQAEARLARAQEQLYQVQKLESIGRLAGGIAHDLNNVLMPIVGYTQLLLANFPPPSQVHEDLREVSKAAGRAANLVRQILAFSRKQVLQLEELDLNEVIADFGSMLRRLIGEHIRIETSLPPGLPPVRADRSQLEQVILNLAVNARDAMPDGGDLVIATDQTGVTAGDVVAQSGAVPGPYVRLTVRDTGQGMDLDTRQHAFEPFFTTKEVGKGTGLGLATVFGIVKQHGGHIAAESEPGRGTTFTIWIPAADEAAAERENEGVARVEARTAAGTVLVVEDDASVRRLVCAALRGHGFTVLDVENAPAALALASRSDQRIDLLLTDVVMPGMNGQELFKRLSALRPRTKVLFMSGYTDEGVAHYLEPNPGAELLQKPFSVGGLLAKVRELLG